MTRFLLPAEIEMIEAAVRGRIDHG